MTVPSHESVERQGTPGFAALKTSAPDLMQVTAMAHHLEALLSHGTCKAESFKASSRGSSDALPFSNAIRPN